jgi:hypothetical protein
MPATTMRKMTDAKGSGFLAIFSDVDLADETDYLHWLTREHVQERLSVPGFVAVRVFRTEAEGRGRFLIFYRLQEAGVVASEAYLSRLNAPSEWSQRIMPKLKNFARGGGKILQESANGEGTYIAPVLFKHEALKGYLGVANEVAKADRMAATRIFEVDSAASEIRTNEKAMRSGDRSFEAMLLLEALDEKMLALGLEVLEVRERSIYRQVFSLSKD